MSLNSDKKSPACDKNYTILSLFKDVTFSLFSSSFICELTTRIIKIYAFSKNIRISVSYKAN